MADNARSVLVKLNSNESPYPVPEVLIDKAVARAAWRVNRYPAAPPAELCALYAAYASESAGLTGRRRIEPDQVVPTNGGDEAIVMTVEAVRPLVRQVVVMPPTFSEYARAAQVAGLPVVEVPLTSDFRVDLDRLVDTVSRAPSLVFICDPNNPTGNRLDAPAALAALTRARPDTYVALDEAYWEFNTDDPREPALTAVGLVADHPNLIVMRTMSKAFALAGARLGMVIAAPETAARVEGVRMLYNINAVSMAMGEVVLAERAYVGGIVARVIAGRRQLAAGLAGVTGLSPHPSWTNFVLAGTPRPAGEVAAAMQDRGILIRVFPDAPWMNRSIRISVGRPEEIGRCLEALSDVMEGDR